MPVLIRGVIYPSARHAAKAFGITKQTVNTLVARGRADQVGLGKGAATAQKRTAVPGVKRLPVRIAGTDYHSMAAAARALNIPYEKLKLALRGKAYNKKQWERIKAMRAPKEEVIKAAVVSPCGTYRYSLSRLWQPGAPTMTFVMLNPSTADADLDDPTIRRCMGFARREGCGSIMVVNCFAFRATDPDALLGMVGGWRDGAVGPENEKHIHAAIRSASGPIVCAWGAFGKTDPGNWLRARYAAHGLWCFGLTKDGRPKHPLYLSKDAPLIPFQ